MKTNLNSVSRAVKFALVATTVASASFAMPVIAQTADDASVEKIAVVGSRAAPRSVAESPVPIDIIGGEELSKAGNTDMLEILKSAVPSLNVHSNPISDAASLVRPANLRGLPADSTLILLNGKRRHRSSVIAFLGGGINDGAQGPDISVIPSVALKQVEVLRDGAAAQYGSDAIAGVINFVLKDGSDGGTIYAKQGQYTDEGENMTEVGGSIGMPLTDDGFVNLSFQYKNSDATSRSVQRADATLFNEAGLNVANPAQIWGSPEVKDDISIFGNAGLDLGNGAEAYIFGNYSERDVRGGFYFRNPHTRGTVYSLDGGDTLLVGDLTPGPEGQINNGLGLGDGISCPVIPITSGNVTQQQDYIDGVANDPNCFAFNEILPDGFTPNFGGNITDTSLTIGTKGEFQAGMLSGISYDFSGTVGRSESSFLIFDTINASLGPDTPRDFAPGKYIQLEKNFNADFVKYADVGFYDDVSIATGIEWHEESFEVVAGDEASFEVGPLTSQGFGIGSNGFPGFQPAAAGVFTRRNAAAYIDAELPITADLLVGAALRFENYDSFGSTTNYKISAQYNATDDLSFRSSVSSGFRAPTVGQANVSNVQTNLDGGVLVDSALLPPTNPIAVQLGGTELQPEESQSYTLGAVYTVGDVFLTVDYYNIEVTDRLSQSDNINLSAADKDVLREAGVPNVDSLQQVSFFTNDFDTTTQGIDVVANYTTELLDGDAVFSLAYNWNETTVDKFSEITGDFKVKRLEEDLPNHRATLTWAQSWEDITAFTRLNYYGEYQGVHVDFDATAITADAAVTVDAEVSYNFNESFVLTAGAQNLLNQEAERINIPASQGIPNNNWGGVYYETSPFGFNGRLLYAKIAYNF